MNVFRLAFKMRRIARRIASDARRRSCVTDMIVSSRFESALAFEAGISVQIPQRDISASVYFFSLLQYNMTGAHLRVADRPRHAAVDRQ
jgi:hypothetical protein